MTWLSTFEAGGGAAFLIAIYLGQMTLLLAAGLLIARRYRWDAAMRHHVLMLTWVAFATAPLLSWGFASSQLVASWQQQAYSSVSAWVTNEPSEAAPIATVPSFALPTEVVMADPEPLPAPAYGPVALSYHSIALAGGLVWLMGIVVGLVRLANSARKLARIRRSSEPLPVGHRVVVVCRQAADGLGVARAPEVRLSSECSGPVVIGFWRPIMLLPELVAQTLPPEKLRQVVVHEMAHVVRRDYLVAWGQHALATLFWFHPLVHLFNRQLAQAREELCDNHVLAEAKETDYGYTLLSVAEAAGDAVAPRLAVGLFTETWSLESRIAQILHERRKTMTRVSWNRASLAGLGALSLTGALALCSPLGAHEPSTDITVDAAEAVETSENTKVERIILTKGPDGVVEDVRVEVEVIGSATDPNVGKVIVTKGADGKVDAVRVKKTAKHSKKTKPFWFHHGAGVSGDGQPTEFFLHVLDTDASGDGQPRKVVLTPPKPPAPPADVIERVLAAENDRLDKVLDKHILHAKERARESGLNAIRAELRLLEAQKALSDQEASEGDRKHSIQEEKIEGAPTELAQLRRDALLRQELLEARRELAIQKQRFDELAKELDRRLKRENEWHTKQDKARIEQTKKGQAAERE